MLFLAFKLYKSIRMDETMPLEWLLLRTLKLGT